MLALFAYQFTQDVEQPVVNVFPFKLLQTLVNNSQRIVSIVFFLANVYMDNPAAIRTLNADLVDHFTSRWDYSWS